MKVVVRAARIKDSSDSSHFSFEIDVGKRRIRHRPTLKMNDNFLDRPKTDGIIQIQSRSMSDSSFSDIDFKNKLAWA